MNQLTQPHYAPTLFLPSLVSDDFIVVANVTREEAEAYVGFFDKMVSEKRKLKSNPSAVIGSFNDINGKLDLVALLDDESLPDLVESLSVSSLSGQRGRRAVFLDIENDDIGVGTTVIYNANWATQGVGDPTLLGTVLDAVEAAHEAA
jgi:hypothetical protein